MMIKSDFHIFQGVGIPPIPHDFNTFNGDLASGKRLHNYGESPLLMGKLTISMAIFQFAILS